jgi:8-oxo-dGTP diphosphatase
VPDHEHDEWAWWPADVERWPAEADPRLRLMGRLLDN